MRFSTACILLLLIPSLLACEAMFAEEESDVILTNAQIWTADDDRPWADAMVMRGDRIVAVLDEAEVEDFTEEGTEVIDLEGRFVAPGFIDNHTHFNSAGALLLGANLLAVSDAAALAEEIEAARDRLPEGAWITGGDWGAYEEWEMGDAGASDARIAQERFRPHRDMIDPITPETPVLINRWDRSEHLANAAALEAAGLSCEEPVEGLECEDGAATGHVSADALRQVRDTIPEKSFEQRIEEALVALEQLREYGVTGIHDNTPDIQREVFETLRDRGQLTTRVYARPTLDRWEELAEQGITHGYGDDMVTIGGLKGWVDGIMGNSTAMFYEPFEHNNEFGIWRDIMDHPDGMEGLIQGADANGHWPQIHAIGDKAIDTLLTMYENVIEMNGPRDDRRFRIIHTQHLRDASVADRMAENDIIAEVQPYHAIDDMRWMEERIGDRIRWAYAFRTLHDAGVLLSFGSDWPGTNASWYPANPMKGVYAAVTRKTLDGEPEGGWIPEERIDLETAMRAYTINNAFAAGEEDDKGSIEPGKLADLVVLDRNPFEIDDDELKDVQVLKTILGGEIVFEREEAISARD